ncbi:MAG TPA: hypothetical protein VH595_17150 [Verrucomicrobiae bacterium]|jgi:hypothetical protein|nr:hypothetical protein [Verrucomicrobiae bacterium]
MLRPKRKLIISVHGIRTTGAWQKQIASIVSERGWIYYPLDYGFFPFFFFAVPFLRRQKIEWFRCEFNKIKERYPGVTPSVIAHSNGTYIVSEALWKYPGLKIDKLILCGSIVRQDFTWETIFARKQATSVRNEIGIKDWASKLVRLVGWLDTGPSGQKGFSTRHDRLKEERFAGYSHSSSFGYEHYENYWWPFLEAPIPYEGDAIPPWYSEEPVSPQDAARWSAMTYYHQYVRRVSDAIVNDDIYSKETGDLIKTCGLTVVVPETPGGADKNPRSTFFAKNGMKEGIVGKTDRRSVYYRGEMLFDIPTTLNSLTFLDHRQDEELREAVPEFTNLLRKLIGGAKSNCAELVKVVDQKAFK